MPNRPLTAPALPQSTFDPAGAFEQVSRLQVAQTAMQKARQDSEERLAIQQLAQQYPDDPDAFVAALQRVAPEKAAKYNEDLWSGRRNAAQAHKAQTEATSAQLEAGIQLLQGSTPQTIGPRIQMVLRMSPDLAQILPDPTDPAAMDKLQGVFQIGQKTKDFLKAQSDAAQLLIDGKTRESVLTMFGAASNPQQWQVAAELTKQAGLGAMLGLVGPEWSQQAQQAAAAASISPEKKVTEARQAATEARQAAQFRTTEARQAARDVQQSRHERVMEGLATRAETRLSKEKEKGAEVVKLPAAIAEKVAGVEQSLSVLDDLERLKSDEWLGPIAGRYTQAKMGLPGTSVDPKLAEFTAQTATLKNAVIKATTGAAMSEPEAQRIMTQIPDFTDKPEIWKQKAATTRRNITLLRKRMLELSGVAQPDGEKGGAKTVRMKAPNGQVKEISADQVDFYKSRGATVVP